MAIPKVKGIETEYSIVLKDRDGYQPAAVSNFEEMISIVRRYFKLPPNSFEDSLREIENLERTISPGDLPRLSRFSRGSFHHNLLPNGARFYIDNPHLEYSTAECLSARTLVAADRTGETLVALAREMLNKLLVKDGAELIVRKDNTDRNGTSYGCHENYLVSRDAFSKIVNPSALEVGYLASFLVCRIIFAGSGKMGIEADGERWKEGDSVYQISQRADFMNVLLSDSTIANRGIVNSRDEPMADERRFGRLHIICGDANLAEVANYMKVGITSIVLKMIEDGFLKGDIIIGDPTNGIKLASRDLTCKKPVLETMGGRKLSALDLLEEFSDIIQDYLSRIDRPLPEDMDLASRLVETISDFRTGNEARLRRRFDWKIKQMIFDYFLEAHGILWKDIGRATVKEGRRSYRVLDELSKKDILYHDLDKERGLYWAAKHSEDVEELVGREDVLGLIRDPPPECRSYFRGRCLAKFFDDMDVVDWGEIVFRRNATTRDRGGNFLISSQPFHIEMTDPTWGGKDDVGEIIDTAVDYEDLLEKLQRRNKEVSR